MSSGTTMQTLSHDRLLAIVARQSGVGFSVSNKALTSNVATLTTSSAHSFVAGDIVTVRGVDSTFDGIQTVVSAPTTTTFTYAKTASNVGSTAVTAIAGASKRVKQGYTRYSDSENLNALVLAQTSYTQGYWSSWVKSVGISQNAAMPFVIHGELLVYVPKDSTNDMNQTWDFALGIASAIGDEASYDHTTGEVQAESVNFSLHRIEVKSAGGIAIFDFGAYGEGSINFIDP